jgi:hypothetical protein
MSAMEDKHHKHIVDLLGAARARDEGKYTSVDDALLHQMSNSEGRSTGVLKALLQGSADIDLTNKDGCTALHLAVLAKDIAFVRELLKNGTADDVCNLEGLTALDIARSQYTKNVLEFLKGKTVHDFPGLEGSPATVHRARLLYWKYVVELLTEKDKIMHVSAPSLEVGRWL